MCVFKAHIKLFIFENILFQFLRKFFLKMKINACPKIHIIISPLCRPSHVWAHHIN